MPSKSHLRKSGSRSWCRYTSRPGRAVRLLSLAEFEKLPVEQRCGECNADGVPAERLLAAAKNEGREMTKGAAHLQSVEERKSTGR